jgi:DNA-directed RNA polymerase subunit K/omega
MTTYRIVWASAERALQCAKEHAREPIEVRAKSRATVDIAMSGDVR